MLVITVFLLILLWPVNNTAKEFILRKEEIRMEMYLVGLVESIIIDWWVIAHFIGMW